MWEHQQNALKIADKKATATLTIKNTGKVAGAEVLQLYVKEQSPKLDRPDKELKSFNKVFLQPGESQQVTFDLDESAFSYYDEVKAKWTMDAGKFDILIGSSSRDIRQQATLEF